MKEKNPYQVVKHQRVTEKAIDLENLKNATSNVSLARCKSPKYVFVVEKTANKKEIAEAIEQIKLGNVTASSLVTLLSYLNTNRTNFRLQRYVDVQALNLSTGAQVKVREQSAVPTNREYIYDINSSGNAIASATTPFTLQSFTPAATETVPSPETVNIWVPDLGYIKS